eukprot:2184713-Prymnesium_polylepis.2
MPTHPEKGMAERQRIPLDHASSATSMQRDRLVACGLWIRLPRTLGLCLGRSLPKKIATV